MRVRPVMFSDSTGLRLCGIADEPFWPCEKNSSCFKHFGALQMADFRRQLARPTRRSTPSVAKYIAWRSRGITCVDIGSGVRPMALAT